MKYWGAQREFANNTETNKFQAKCPVFLMYPIDASSIFLLLSSFLYYLDQRIQNCGDLNSFKFIRYLKRMN